MASVKIFNKETGKWEIHGVSNALEVGLVDIEENFESTNVEGALREVSTKQKETDAKIEGQKDFQDNVTTTLANHSGTLSNHGSRISSNTNILTTHTETLKLHDEDIEWLKENGSTGTPPTITSTFVDGTIVDKDVEVEIPIFFSSTAIGDGLAYILMDGVEVGTQGGIKQGNNKVNIGKLTKLKTEVAIYVKDKKSRISNQLSWTIICGGIDIEIDFDFNADYTPLDIIAMQYTIITESTDPIIMHLTVDYSSYEIPCKKGFNEYVFEGLGVGIHKVTLYVTTGKYSTKPQTFNIVVVNSNSLYVSSTFENESQWEYGVPIPVNYRISKASSEQFNIVLMLDGVEKKSLQAGVGSYYWTLNDIEIGDHNIKITVTSEYGENESIERVFKVIKGEYEPVKITEAGLIYRLNAFGRTNADSDRTLPVDNSGNNIKTELKGFNYFSNGWINDELVCDGNSYVEIDCFPWRENAVYGSTIEVQYKALDIGFDDARIIDYTDIEPPFKGFYIDLNETTMKSLANTGMVNLDQDVYTTVTYVIDRKSKFGKIYIDGVCSRAFTLSDTGSGTGAIREDFTHNQKIYLNSRKGQDRFGACNIKDVRIYNRVLNDDEILRNNIAQIKDLREQKKKYDFNYNNVTLPKIHMYGDISNMTLEQSVPMRFKYTSPNEEEFGQSLDLPFCEVCLQGTSSLQYVLKNFTVRLKDENMADYYYTPFKNGIKESIYCLKCDYMESTKSRNTGLGKFVNSCLYDTKNPAQLQDPNVRNSINGFPCELYINDEYYAMVNFNLDRFSSKSYGYDKFKSTLVYEISANSDSSGGAFFSWKPETGMSELDYYKSDFNCLYPPTRASGNDNMEELIRLIKWVDNASNEDFKDNIGKYFNLEYLLRYFLMVQVFGAVDRRIVH